MVGYADVLEHADRGDLVKAALNKRIVAQFERHLVFKPKPGNLFPCIRELFICQRHAMGANTKVLGGVTDKCTPTTADVEQAFPRLKAQFAANHIELIALGGRKIVVPVPEIGAG